MLKSGKSGVMLYRRGDSWQVCGPPHLVKPGCEVEAYLPSGKTSRSVTVGRVLPYEGSYGDGTWVTGEPVEGRRCAAQIRGKRCVRQHAHPGWCRDR